jgi:hypothetical protein
VSSPTLRVVSRRTIGALSDRVDHSSEKRIETVSDYPQEQEEADRVANMIWSFSKDSEHSHTRHHPLSLTSARFLRMLLFPPLFISRVSPHLNLPTPGYAIFGSTGETKQYVLSKRKSPTYGCTPWVPIQSQRWGCAQMQCLRASKWQCQNSISRARGCCLSYSNH